MRKHTICLLVLMLAVALASTPVVAGHDKMSKKVAEKANRGGADKVDVIVIYKEMPDQAEADRVKGLGGKMNRSYSELPMRAMQIPARALEALGNGDGVEFVAQDSEVLGFSDANRATANTPPIGSTYDSLYNGSPYALAVIDSGVGVHVDVPVILQVDFTGDELNTPNDPFGHGTHVAGIATGLGSGSGYVHWGQAYGAKVISLRALDGNGSGNVSDVLAALDWLLLNGAANSVRVVNMSIGKAIEEEAALDPLVQAVEAVWDAGMVVVVSAGNYGRDGFGTISSPGNSRKVITVGSITDNGTGTDLTDDYLSTYSSKGPTLYDRFVKPDILAPGNRSVASMAIEGKMMTDLPERIADCGTVACNDEYLELSGTSMAAAMVSGTAIRMISREPGLNPASVKARLMKSARKLSGFAPYEAGAGVLDITAALDATGMLSAAPSPKLTRSEEGEVLLMEDPAALWGDTQWSAAFIYTDGFIWSDSFLYTDGYVWSDAFLFTDSFVWSDAFLFTDAFIHTDAFIYSDSFIFTDSFVFTDRVQNADPVFEINSESSEVSDDLGSSGTGDPADDR
jgi:subtilisin family serine protease